MASAQFLRIAGVIDSEVREIADDVDQVRRSWSSNRIHAGHAGSIILTGNQLRQDLRRWLSPPDPSTNHNIACKAHHKGTADVSGMEVNRFRIATLDSWETYTPVLFCRLAPPNNIPYL
jgi:hypothetical protein